MVNNSPPLRMATIDRIQWSLHTVDVENLIEDGLLYHYTSLSS